MHDGHAPGDRPSPGDVSLCWKCGGAAIFTDDGVRLPTPDEATELDADPDVRAARAAMAEAYTPRQATELRRLR